MLPKFLPKILVIGLIASFLGVNTLYGQGLVEYFMLNDHKNSMANALAHANSDNSTLLVGSSIIPADSSASHSFFIKLDSQGDTLWARAYQRPGRFFQATNAIAVSGGAFVVMGTVYNTAAEAFVGGDLGVAKLDAQGDVLWFQEFAGMAGPGIYAPQCFCSKDGGVVLSTHHTVVEEGMTTATPLIIKLSDAGAITWQASYLPDNQNQAALIRKVIRLQSGGYAFVGTAFDHADAGAQLMVGRTNAQGQIMAVRKLQVDSPQQAEDYQSAGMDILEDADGSFVVLSMALNPAHNELVVLKLSPQAEVLSANSFAPAQGKVSYIGAWETTSDNSTKIIDAFLTKMNYTHAIHKTPLGYLVHMSTGEIQTTSFTEEPFFNYQSAFLNLNADLQPQWLRELGIIQVEAEDWGATLNQSLVSNAACINATGDLLFAGGATSSLAGLHLINSCIIQQGSLVGTDGDCNSQELEPEVTPFFLRATGDLSHSCGNPADLSFVSGSYSNWQFVPFALSLGSYQTPTPTAADLAAAADINLKVFSDCAPTTSDQDFSGPIRVRDMPEMDSPTRLVGSNEQGVLGAVVGQNPGDVLVWENDVWSARPAPGGSGGNGTAWMTAGDSIVYLPEDRRVGIGTAQPLVSLHVSGRTILGDGPATDSLPQVQIYGGIPGNPALTFTSGKSVKYARYGFSEEEVVLIDSLEITYQAAVEQGYGTQIDEDEDEASDPDVITPSFFGLTEYAVVLHLRVPGAPITFPNCIANKVEGSGDFYIKKEYEAVYGNADQWHDPIGNRECGGNLFVENRITAQSISVANQLNAGDLRISNRIVVGNANVGLGSIQHTSSGLTLTSGSTRPWEGITISRLEGVRVRGNSLVVTQRGNVGIGVAEPPSGYKLAVAGKILCEEVRVKLRSRWPDYVFEDTHKLMPLDDLEAYIKEHKHLPGMKPATELEAEGVDLLETVRQQQQKIEELTLYILELKQKIK